jgi:hypothetical protein
MVDSLCDNVVLGASHAALLVSLNELCKADECRDQTAVPQLLTGDAGPKD